MSNRSVGENSLMIKRLKGNGQTATGMITQISNLNNHDEKKSNLRRTTKPQNLFFSPLWWLTWTLLELHVQDPAHRAAAMWLADLDICITDKDFYIPKVGSECTDLEMLFKMGFSVSSAHSMRIQKALKMTSCSHQWRILWLNAKTVSLSHLSCDLDADLIQHLVHNVLRFFLVSRVLEEIVQRVVHWGGEKKPIPGSLRFTAGVGFSRVDST